jgi:hypothetical protein
MSERAFKDGYAGGANGSGETMKYRPIPACSIPPGKTAYQAGAMLGLRDAGDLVTKSDGVDSILDRALNRKPQRN